MRKIICILLIFIFSIVLCLNVVRTFFVEPDEQGTYSTVDTFTILDAIAEFEVDPTYLFNDLAKCASRLASAADNFTSVFTRFAYMNDGDIWDIVSSFFRNIAESVEDLWLFMYNFMFVLADVFRFIYEFVTAFFRFANKILGSVFDTSYWHYDGNIGGGGFNGGGFGGRR